MSGESDFEGSDNNDSSAINNTKKNRPESKNVAVHKVKHRAHSSREHRLKRKIEHRKGFLSRLPRKYSAECMIDQRLAENIKNLRLETQNGDSSNEDSNDDSETQERKENEIDRAQSTTESASLKSGTQQSTTISLTDDDDSKASGDSGHDSVTEKSREKPLMQLFRRLIGNDNKQMTVLTNAQIVEILEDEFDINVLALHDLEIEIYLNIMKKFLKDWPQWDELDKVLKNGNDHDKTIEDVIQVKYNNLRTYLKICLDASKPTAKKAVANAIKATKGKSNDVEIDTSDLVMEIKCTRSQLNKLIIRRPLPNKANSIFNISDTTQFIKGKPLSFGAILNWWNISMEVNLAGFQYKRKPTQELKHVLLNKKLPTEQSDSNELDQDLEIKADDERSCVYYNKSAILNYLKRIMDLKDYERADCFIELKECEVIFEIIKNDLQHFTDVIRVPASYRRYTNKYKYVRYLYKDTAERKALRKYDLQIEETLSPQIVYEIDRFEPDKVEIPKYDSWLTIECIDCSEKYRVETIIELMKHQHTQHQNEPPWRCTHCLKEFPMAKLVHRCWEHKCEFFL